MSALVCGSISASYCIQGAKDRCLLSLSVELSSFLALSLPSSLFLAALSPPSSLLLVVRQPSYCLLFLFSFIFSPTATRITTTSLRIGVFLVCLPSYCLFFSLSHPPFPSSWSSVSRAIVFFPLLLSFSSSTTTMTTTTLRIQARQ